MPCHDGSESVGEKQKRERGQADRILIAEFSAEERSRYDHLGGHIVIRAWEATEHKAAHGGFTRGRRAYLRSLLKSPDFIAECRGDRQVEEEARRKGVSVRAHKAEQAKAAHAEAEAQARAREDSRGHAIALLESMSDEKVAAVLEEIGAEDRELAKRIRHCLTVYRETPREVALRAGVRAAFIARAEVIASGARRTVPLEEAA